MEPIQPTTPAPTPVPVQPQSEPIVPVQAPIPTKPSKLPVVLLSLALILVCVIAGYFYLQMQNLKKGVVSPAVSPTSATSPSPSPTTDPVADWKTYTNSEFNFQYPSEYILKNNLLTSKENEIQINIVQTGSPMYNECMKLYGTETIGELMVKKYSENTTGEMCSGRDGNQKENWIVKAGGKGYEPGIQFIYSSKKSVQAESVFNRIVSTFKFTGTTSIKTSPSPSPTIPVGWKTNKYNLLGLTIYSPSDWESSIENFTSTQSTLIRFWKKTSPNIVPIQIDIKSNWDNTGNAKNYVGNYMVAGLYPAYRVDPPKTGMERYQTNVYFEKDEKVYVFQCTHNWQTDYMNTCNKMLETLKFSN